MLESGRRGKPWAMRAIRPSAAVLGAALAGLAGMALMGVEAATGTDSFAMARSGDFATQRGLGAGPMAPGSPATTTLSSYFPLVWNAALREELPDVTPRLTPSALPSLTLPPAVTASPAATASPNPSASPVATGSPSATTSPETTGTPPVSPTSTDTPGPLATLTPSGTATAEGSPIPMLGAAGICDLQCLTRDEYIEICNRGGAAVDLLGWRILADKATSVFYFPGYTLDPGASVFVHSGPDAPPAMDNHLLWTDRLIWDNFEDRAHLYNDRDELVETRVCQPLPTPTP